MYQKSSSINTTPPLAFPPPPRDWLYIYLFDMERKVVHLCDSKQHSEDHQLNTCHGFLKKYEIKYNINMNGEMRNKYYF